LFVRLFFFFHGIFLSHEIAYLPNSFGSKITVLVSAGRSRNSSESSCCGQFDAQWPSGYFVEGRVFSLGGPDCLGKEDEEGEKNSLSLKVAAWIVILPE
jgi:hypothetical protein